MIGPELQVVSEECAVTEFGLTVVKSELVYDGSPRTFFHPQSLAGGDPRFIGTIMAIEDAERRTSDPNTQAHLDHWGVSLEEYIESGSDEIIEAYKSNGGNSRLAGSDLEPLMRQRALKKLFETTK